MHRTVSQRKISTPHNDTMTVNKQNTEGDDKPKEQPSQWGWYVNGERTPPIEFFSKPTRQDPAELTAHHSTKSSSQPTHQPKLAFKANLSFSEFVLIECLSCCHPTLRNSVLSLTGLCQKLEPQLKNTEKANEPKTFTINCR